MKKGKLYIWRFIACSIIFVAYIYILRDIRYKSSQFGLKVVEQKRESSTTEIDSYLIGTTLHLTKSKGYSRVLKFKFPFGLFFLISILGLILIRNSEKNYFYALFFIHSCSALLFFALVYTIPKSFYFFLLADLMSRYLVPVFSIVIVAFSYKKKRVLNGR